MSLYICIDNRRNIEKQKCGICFCFFFCLFCSDHAGKTTGIYMSRGEKNHGLQAGFKR
ncbi:hypothetical protein CLOSCI_01774 [[Clostridium] scindens ATCC 35704]|nr:hypothetical protein CLOSCI_01774 [[Clostridium] scindens ATCC 35704]